MSTIYTCGIIEESLTDPSILAGLSKFLHASRVQAGANEQPTWHLHEYHFPETELKRLIPELQRNIRRGEWYIHAFNVESRELYVILSGKTFLLPTKKDKSWDEMIAYGESVGCGPRWTANIPLRV